MTKADLVEMIHKCAGLSTREAAEVVDSVLEIIKDSLRRGDKVKISRFGSFAVNQKRARRGRNPQTGTPLIISSRCVLSFKASDILKQRLRS
ncbi:MAG: integration host factor subunit alpha [Deltaproteobacteria bacterium]|nr:integration host factor subunit alpha [Deltaproteobacteria bacterium]